MLEEQDTRLALLVAKYHYDGSGVMAMTRNNSSYWYAFEAIGTVRQMMDGQGQVSDAYAFDAWGNALTSPQSQVPNPFRYVGKHGYYLDTQSALMLLGVRYYSAEIGRFSSLDPMAKGLNWYQYPNNPIKNIDPTGLQVEYCPKCGGIAYGGYCPRCGPPGPPDRPVPIPPPPPPIENTFFSIDHRSCRRCPHITIALDLAIQWIRSNRSCSYEYNRICQPIRPTDTPTRYCVSIPGLGLVDCSGRRSEQVNISCRNLGRGIGGRSPGCREIEININHPGCNDPSRVRELARTIIHELAHICFWCAGRPYNPPFFPRPEFHCPFGCGRVWRGPDKVWEACAELLAHKCSGR